jgi:hypothetical protein
VVAGCGARRLGDVVAAGGLCGDEGEFGQGHGGSGAGARPGAEGQERAAW